VDLIENKIIKNHDKEKPVEPRNRDKENRIIVRMAKTNFSNCRSESADCLAPLAGASHVKQLFVYLSYPAGQLSSAISGTR